MKHPIKISAFCLLSITILLLMFSAATAQPKKTVRKKTTATTPKKNVNPIRIIKPDEPIIGGIVNGKAIFLAKPEYPEEVAKLKISGTVGVEVLIDESGNVISAKAAKGVDNLSLRTACEKAAMQAKFSPTLLNGTPTKVSGTINYNFVLNEEPKKSNEELKFVGLGFFLNTIQNAASDSFKFADLFDFKDFKSEFTDEFGNFPEDIMKDILTLSNLRELTDKQKIEAIDKATDSIFAKLNESELWQFKLGKDFSDLLGVFSNAVDKDGFNADKLNEKSAKLIVANIKDLLKTPPANFPPKVLQKFNELIVDSDQLDVANATNTEKFLAKLSALVQAISSN
jgi:TonB family protein